MEQASSSDRRQSDQSTNSPNRSSPRRTANNPPRDRAASADVGMVPASSAAPSNVSPSEAKADSTAIASPETPAPAKALSPQERKNKKLQQQLEKSLVEALPAETKPSRIISSLMPGSNGKDLNVTLNSDWYQLEPGQQDAIAATIWNQRTNLKFQQLTLKDLKGKTIARPPVVGEQMVILRR